MAWICLVLAGLGEVIGVFGLNMMNTRKRAAGFAVLACGFVISFSLLTIAMQSISMGTAYAIWTGIGTVGATVIGMLFYGESRHGLRLLCLALVVCSAVGLKLIG
ncbi:multidrug efflux SMR transporter [Cohnella lubricantis]|uniref:Multidrug efflux SMR transporter n=1 Tax=Cohnella lubricantis TaxID=2163172 RepID=A0A841THC6_9BACL|nr:multidrug efflux SMR transporter [Cohnella lubricantis]MBB6679319.1 multidrug efflux SMR transporter [Cohnella lubricantis]MBP2118742.1 paired small multidrug resistance pump [Cohnella lubricantis]